jgi:hypothetical protein
MMRTVFYVTLALALLAFGVSKGAEPDKIRDALDENFAAYNAEDLPRLMRSVSAVMPGRQQFAREAAQVFADNDVYISVHEYELLAVRPPWAAARVVQVTLPAKDEPVDPASYRAGTRLLPEERSEYIQTFKKEGGKWRLWLIEEPPAAQQRAACPNGNCSFPRVSVNLRR